jgi:hypothetical protein
MGERLKKHRKMEQRVEKKAVSKDEESLWKHSKMEQRVQK